MEAVRNASLPRRGLGSSLPSTLALGLLAACGFSAGVHVALAPEHLRESAPLGLAFLLAAALLLGLGLVVYERPRSAGPPLLIALLSVALIAAYIATRTVGLPGLHPEPEPVDPAGAATQAVELVGLVLGLWLYRENAAGTARCKTRRKRRWTSIP